jgi:alkylation response protein AidB-like acyl-CoA dehydrogenase
VQAELRDFVAAKAHDLPHPGAGRTWHRFGELASWAAKDLSLGRLVEGHADALSILAECRGTEFTSSTYGVWAARATTGGTKAARVRGGWQLSGVKPFCSGSDQLDRALVTADTADGYRLFDISVADQVISVLPCSWPAVGMADSQSESLEFGGPVVPEQDAIGGPEFYLERPGFWYGATGVAACWFGGASALLESAKTSVSPTSGDHALVDLGRAVALVEGMRVVLKDAAQAIDADPVDTLGKAHRRALTVRQLVHDGCLQVLSLVAGAAGAGPLCHDPEQARRTADLFVYLAQHHGGADAAELGRISLASNPQL